MDNCCFNICSLLDCSNRISEQTRDILLSSFYFSILIVFSLYFSYSMTNVFINPTDPHLDLSISTFCFSMWSVLGICYNIYYPQYIQNRDRFFDDESIYRL